MACQLDVLQRDFLSYYETIKDGIIEKHVFETAGTLSPCKKVQRLKQADAWFKTKMTDLDERILKWMEETSFQATPFSYTPAESEKVLKRHKWQKLASMVATAALICAHVISTIAIIIVAVDNTTFFMAKAMGAAAFPVKLGIVGVHAVLDLYLIWLSFKPKNAAGSVLERKARIINDPLFQDFVTRRISKNIPEGRYLDEKSLLDKDLYLIYLDYKKDVEEAQKYVEQAKKFV